MSDGQDSTTDEKMTARAIVAGHGEFAAGLVSAVEIITGRGAQLISVAVPGLCAEDIEKLIRQRMVESGVKVIFTDLQAGSCTMAARRILRGADDAVLIAGVNLPTLLDFVFAEQMGAVEAARHSAERGKAAITVVGATGTAVGGGAGVKQK
ncbi:MAG: PTS sugar transporter subunit IIA [Gemmatimonadaceae bacterium]